jgi:hypothetical protein
MKEFRLMLGLLLATAIVCSGFSVQAQEPEPTVAGAAALPAAKIGTAKPCPSCQGEGSCKAAITLTGQYSTRDVQGSQIGHLYGLHFQAFVPQSNGEYAWVNIGETKFPATCLTYYPAVDGEYAVRYFVGRKGIVSADGTTHSVSWSCPSATSTFKVFDAKPTTPPGPAEHSGVFCPTPPTN